MRIYRSISEQIYEELSYEKRINGYDKVLINSWHVGRKLAIYRPELAVLAKNGELPVLTVKGGIDRAIKQDKIGSLWYLATWQGLRGEDLDVDPSGEIELVCSRTGVRVLFTLDIEKLAEVDD